MTNPQIYGPFLRLILLILNFKFKNTEFYLLYHSASQIRNKWRSILVQKGTHHFIIPYFKERVVTLDLEREDVLLYPNSYDIKG